MHDSLDRGRTDALELWAVGGLRGHRQRSRWLYLAGSQL